MINTNFAGLAPSVIYAAVAEAVLYDDLDQTGTSTTLAAIVAGLEVEMGNNGPEAFFRGVADELKRKQLYGEAQRHGVDLEEAFQAAVAQQRA